VVTVLVITAKFDKKKLIIAALLILIAVVAAIVLSLTGSSGKNDASTSGISVTVKNNDERVAYLRSFGWQVSSEPIEQQTITIPKSFNDVYSEYNALQLSQGFDLSKYCGLEAVRYTYQVTNYPGQESGVVADMIVCKNKVIAGDIQSISVNGFMAGLKFPEDAEG
jgi:carbohydrate-selective porin OprB